MPRKKSNKITPRQKTVLKAIAQFQDENGYPPTIREIVSSTEITSTSVVNYYLNQLEERGYLERDNHVARSIRLLQPANDILAEAGKKAASALEGILKVPVVGAIAAGEPIEIPETGFSIFDAETSIDLPGSLLSPRTRTDALFALEVHGDSMIDALVNDGDKVILQRAEDAQNGDMVAAWLTEEESTTLKYFYRENGGVRLQPANPAYEPIFLNGPDALKIQGKVIMVVRQIDK